MDSPITTECEALRAEVALLADENRRMLNEILELRKIPAYPEEAVMAVWEHGNRMGRQPYDCLYAYPIYAEEVASVFTEALKNGN